MVKSSLILQNLSPEVTGFTSTHVPVAALPALPPSLCAPSTVDPVSWELQGPHSKPDTQGETTPSPAPGGGLKRWWQIKPG